MKWFSRVLIMTVISGAVAVSLSYLSVLDETAGVFRTVKAQPVSEGNIVDVVSKMQLHLRIRRVEINHAIVSIDLLAVKTTEPTDMVKDLYEIPRYLFGASTNIHQVLIRVLDSSADQGASPQLLIASDARREKWLPSDSRIHPQSLDELQQYLDAHYRMTYTPKWQERTKEKS
ncbi:hypothetical protein [Paenibacillus cremeus]|uniref:Uncharacterized protein n=1 Tax=Paenibacillus cremeus TaxID=2163881 RepID=A0A559KHL2_9BACL|nr:hypothetical protein [Paenibacillus cremeus]TVY11609.1 hypothetical protein FPZ49_02595 [Paenibacillus cremeus]